jgi:hypothetical protein
MEKDLVREGIWFSKITVPMVTEPLNTLRKIGLDLRPQNGKAGIPLNSTKLADAFGLIIHAIAYELGVDLLDREFKEIVSALIPRRQT